MYVIDIEPKIQQIKTNGSSKLSQYNLVCCMSFRITVIKYTTHNPPVIGDRWARVKCFGSFLAQLCKISVLQNCIPILSYPRPTWLPPATASLVRGRSLKCHRSTSRRRRRRFAMPAGETWRGVLECRLFSYYASDGTRNLSLYTAAANTSRDTPSWEY